MLSASGDAASPRIAPQATLQLVELYPYVPYIQYLLPGSIVMSIFMMVMIGGGIIFIDDKARGLHEGYLVTPVTKLELIAGFTCRFHDVRGEKGAAYLDADTAVAYPAGQALAATILAAGGNGLIYPSARDPEGECLAVFGPSVIQNIRQGRIITFEWTGAPEPRILEEV